MNLCLLVGACGCLGDSEVVGHLSHTVLKGCCDSVGHTVGHWDKERQLGRRNMEHSCDSEVEVHGSLEGRDKVGNYCHEEGALEHEVAYQRTNWSFLSF